jgi:hypothetical protein
MVKANDYRQWHLKINKKIVLLQGIQSGLIKFSNPTCPLIQYAPTHQGC